MKKVICLLSILSLLLCACTSNNINRGYNTPKTFQIKISDVVVKEKTVEHTGEKIQYAELDFIDILEKMEIDYKYNNKKIVIYYMGDKFTLFFQNENNEYMYLKIHKENEEFYFPPPGSVSFVCEKTDDKVILDDETIWHIFREIGLPVVLDLNPEASELTITNE